MNVDVWISEMGTNALILKRLSESCRSLSYMDFLLGDLKWEDAQLIRKCAIRAQRGDPGGWRDFINHANTHHTVAEAIGRIFEDLGWAKYSIQNHCMELTFPPEYQNLDDASARDVIAFLNPSHKVEDEKPSGRKVGKIMYIEEKPGLAGPARIGRVSLSGSRKTIYYRGRQLRSLKGAGFKANYYDVEAGLQYWISHCKKDGNDRLYSGMVEIDEDAREEYWTMIRKQPENVHITKIRSRGKYA